MASKFSQRHYEAIAEEIAQSYRIAEVQNLVMSAWLIDNLQDRLVKLFQSDNPAFKESRFREACKPHRKYLDGR